MPPAFAQSRMKAMLDSSNIPQLINDFFPRLMDRIGQEDRQAAAFLAIFKAIGGPVWRHPTAIYFRGVDLANQPVPKAALICQAGADSDTLLGQFQALVLMAGGAPFPVKAFKMGDIVGIEVGFDQEAMAVAGSGANQPKSIATVDNFTSAMAQVVKDPVFCLYADGEGIIALVEKAMKAFGAPREQQDWTKARDVLGLGGIKRLAVSCGFDGRDWSTQAFLNAPAPRAGLMTLLDMKPLTDDIYRAIPASATFGWAARLDLGKLFAQIRNIVGQLDPGDLRDFDKALAEVQQATGVNIQTDLLESLGDQWALYSDPASAGNGILGFVAVNRLAKPAETQQAIAKLTKWVSDMANQAMRRDKMALMFDTAKIGNLEINYLSVPFVRPSWVFKNGNIYFALYPQVLAAALQNVGGKSILDNPDFIALRKRCGNQATTGFHFDDLPKGADNGYQIGLLISQAALGFADLFGVKTPPMVLPTLPKLKENLAPAGASRGWTMRGCISRASRRSPARS